MSKVEAASSTSSGVSWPPEQPVPGGWYLGAPRDPASSAALGASVRGVRTAWVSWCAIGSSSRCIATIRGPGSLTGNAHRGPTENGPTVIVRPSCIAEAQAETSARARCRTPARCVCRRCHDPPVGAQRGATPCWARGTQAGHRRQPPAQSLQTDCSQAEGAAWSRRRSRPRVASTRTARASGPMASARRVCRPSSSPAGAPHSLASIRQ